MSNHIQKYYKSVCDAHSLGNKESSYYSPIISLFAQFGCKAHDLSSERSGHTSENTDIKMWRAEDSISETEPFAVVEAKKAGGIDERALKQVKTQATRYGNAILTDNLIWQFWRTGEDRAYASVVLIEIVNGKLVLKQESTELFTNIVEDFVLRDPAQIRSSSKLAEYMAKHARTIRSVIKDILKDDGTGNPLVSTQQYRTPMFSEMLGLYSKIKEDLRPALNTRDFADMYAQTVVYGLFIARYNDSSKKSFDKYSAIGKLQHESVLLNRFFTHIASSGNSHPMLDSAIDKLCTLYQTSNIAELLNLDEHHDNIVHFYEDFLSHYDPELKKSLGVFYTPYQVVKYLVSMVDRLLVEEFGIPGGLSNNERIQFAVPAERNNASKENQPGTKEISVPRVAILDPACGTGTFLAEIIKHIKSTYFSGSHEAFYENYIQNENGLLSRLIGFEIMMTSYVVAHLKIRRTIVETLGHSLVTQPSTNIYLTNTLAKPHANLEQIQQTSFLIDFSAAITEEAYKADTWKIRRPIKVIIGNPPYLAASTNPYDISAYKMETDGKTRLQEKNPKWLGDDYVKFFRFAEQIISRNDEGVLAFISNNGFLGNPTFRGMRASLLRTFDKIIIVDLHGNANKKEISPDGSKDENVFAIMQGVSLFIGIKKTPSNAWATVHHADLWGAREEKLQRLENADVSFKKLRLDASMAYFSPFGSDENELYGPVE